MIYLLSSNWTYQWKITFNPDKTNSRSNFLKKTPIQSPPALTFDNSRVIKTRHQKHLRLILHKKLIFKEHLEEKRPNIYKGIAVLRKLQNIIQKFFLSTIYKSFVRVHLDCGNSIYHQPNNGSICQKTGSI